MLALSVRSLSGDCVRQFGPMIADLRAQEEQRLPPFHEARLFRDGHELLDNTTVQVEVQVVIAKSSAKALTVVEYFFEKFRSNFTEFEKLEPSDEEVQLTLGALALLDEMNDLTAEQCDQLLCVLCSLPDGSLHGWRYKAVVSLGEVFGRTCLNPRSWIPKLLDEIRSRGMLQETAAARALSEISKRCEDVHEHSEEIGEWARTYVRSILRYGDAEVAVDICGIVRALGRFGKLSDQSLLEGISRQVEGSEAGLRKEAATAAALLLKRHEMSQKIPFGIDGDDNNGGSMEPAANVGIQNPAQGDTDHALEQALCRSEEEAVQHEQSELHEAILRSKSDIPHAPPCEDDITCLDSRLVLLSFTRFPKEFRDALLSSQLAVRQVEQGVELEPDWASPALILSHAVTEEVVSEARELWHVAVCVGDEDQVHEIRLGLCSKTRPRIKTRFLVPLGASLFDDASDWTRRIAVHHFRSTDCRDYPVLNGFLHATGMATGSVKRSRSH